MPRRPRRDTPRRSRTRAAERPAAARPACRKSPAPPAIARHRIRAQENAPDARTGIAASAAWRASWREMIEAVRQRCQFAAAFVADGNALCLLDLPMRVRASPSSRARRVDVRCASGRYGEAKLVIVASGEQTASATSRSPLGEQSVHRRAAGNRRKIDLAHRHPMPGGHGRDRRSGRRKYRSPRSPDRATLRPRRRAA